VRVILSSKLGLFVDECGLASVRLFDDLPQFLAAQGQGQCVGQELLTGQRQQLVEQKTALGQIGGEPNCAMLLSNRP
jgi:hypothetical protein